MAVTQVGTPSAPVVSSGSNSMSVTGSFGTGQNAAQGNLLVALVTAFGTTTSTVPSSATTGWTGNQILSVQGGNVSITVYAIVRGGSAATAPVFTSTGTGTASHAQITCEIVELTGQASSPLVTSGTNSGTTTSLTVTTTGNVPNSSCYALSVFAQGGATSGTGTYTKGVAWTAIADTFATTGFTHSAFDDFSAPPSGSTLAEASSWTATTANAAGIVAVFQPPVTVYGAVRSPSAAGHPSDAFANSSAAGTGARLPVRGRVTGIVKAKIPNVPAPYSSGQPAGVRVIYQRAGNVQTSLIPPLAAAPVLATFYPRNRPAAAVVRPLPPRGVTRSNPGVRNQLGPQLTPLQRPVQARRLPYRGGSAQSRTGIVAPAPFYPLRYPVRARVAAPVRGGRVASNSGVRNQLGPPVTPLRGPVRAAIRVLPPRGRTLGRAGTFTAPVVLATFYQLNGPARAKPPLPVRGVCRTVVAYPISYPGSQLYPLQRPVQAKVTPQPPFGRTATMVPLVTTPLVTLATFYPLNRPAAAVIRPQPPRGVTRSNPGTFSQTGSQLYPLRRPVQARLPLAARGRAQFRAGTFTSVVPQPAVFYPLNHPVSAIVRPLPLRGRTSGRAGVFSQSGSAFYPLRHPVQARRPLPPRGTAQWRYGTFTLVTPNQAVFYPLAHPASAVIRPLPVRGRVRSTAGVFNQLGPVVTPQQRALRARLPQQPLLRGRTSSNPGVFGQAGPAVRPLRGPVAAVVRPFPPRGRAQGRSGVFTPQAGPPVYPLQRPVAAVARPQPPRGRAQGRAGVFQGTGPTVKPLQHPVYAWRPGPRRGVCLTSVTPPPAAGIGSKFYPLRRPVRAPFPPLLRPTGGTVAATPPFVPPFVPQGGHGYPYDAKLSPSRWYGFLTNGEWDGKARPLRYSAASVNAHWPSTATAGRWFTTSGPA